VEDNEFALYQGNVYVLNWKGLENLVLSEMKRETYLGNTMYQIPISIVIK